MDRQIVLLCSRHHARTMRSMIDTLGGDHDEISDELKTEMDFTITCDFYLMLCNYISKYDINNSDDHFADAFREVDALVQSPNGRRQLADNALRVAEKLLAAKLKEQLATPPQLGKEDEKNGGVNYIY